MSIKHNSYQAAANIEAKGQAMAREIQDTLDVQAQLLARDMQREAPTSLSTLRLSIHVETIDPFQRVIGPGVDYALAVHEGRKPGKGLPWYMDPAAKPLQDWLERHLGGGPRGNAKPGSRARQSHEQALRDIYIGWSLKVKARGIEGNPFARRAFEGRVGGFIASMRAAAARGLQAQGSA
ncbi:MAG: hypothetical protein ACK4F4_07370 [Hylemonella sp.]|uniref:hypothetical protein n=1 Tax=Hylemonella sp. TaxID=2066020 RepID=UPI00391C014E